MANLTIYKTEPYNEIYYKVFAGVYNDFRDNAVKNYKFELSPLLYENFIQSIRNGLINCIMLLEDNIPTGFLVYTTIISEAIELNIIHCLGSDNINTKRRLLLEKFIELNSNLMKTKIVTYPMLGKQVSFLDDIIDYGFKTVNTSVMKFNLYDVSAINQLNKLKTKQLYSSYEISSWEKNYKKQAIEVIYDAFKNSSDALFDSRFTTYKGCNDIITKITENVYGQFLPAISKVLLYKRRPVGFCFANLTNDKIANIPILAILKKHRGNGFGKILLKYLISDIINSVILEGKAISELNVSCDADNLPAVRLYSSVGFRSDYSYPTAYHPGLA